MNDNAFLATRGKIRVALGVVAAVWVLMRIGAGPAEPPPAVWRALEEVRAAGSNDTGRIELRGWPDALVDLGISEIPEVRAAAYRLQAEIDDANESLDDLAAVTTSRIESLPGGPVGLRTAGLLVAFSGSDAERLAVLAKADRTRGRETLVQLADLLEARLEEPPPLDQLEGTVESRELFDLHRTVRDAVNEKDVQVQESLEEFRREAFDTVRDGSGPFQRRGRGVVLETVIAALLGVLLRESLRTTPPSGPPQLAAALGPLAALGFVIGLAGIVIPTHPVRGLSPVFVPIAFLTGWITPGLLSLLSKLDRAQRSRPSPARPSVAARVEPAVRVAEPRLPMRRTEPVRRAEPVRRVEPVRAEPEERTEPERRAEPERLPFARKLRTR